MPSPQQQEMIWLYHGLMVEAKARARSINQLTNDQRGIPSPFVYEFGILQIRMLCEIIGLACLVAHGDLIDKAKADLKKTYVPEQIILELDKLHGDFYPVATYPQKAGEGWYFAEYVGPPFLKKGEISGIWSRCGGVLHRGSLKKLLAAKPPVQTKFDDLQEWGQKIINLLNSHRIVTWDKHLAVICQLKAGKTTPSVMLGEAIPHDPT